MNKTELINKIIDIQNLPEDVVNKFLETKGKLSGSQSNSKKIIPDFAERVETSESKKNEFLSETDIIIEHLTMTNSEELSRLEFAMTKGVLYTTVLNAAEVKLLTADSDNDNCVLDLLSALHILGLHYRYSASVNDFYPAIKNVRDALFCVTAKINKLPVLTNNPEKFKKTGLQVFTIEDLRKL